MSLRDYIYAEVSKRFQEFAEKLKDKEIKYGTALQQLEKIRIKLEQKLPKFTQSRTAELAIESVHYGGILEEGKPGMFDVIIKLNEENKTQLAEILEIFLRVLKKHCLYLEIDLDSFQVFSKDSSINFNLEDGLDCRLHVHRASHLSAQATYKLMRTYGNKARFYTSHLVSSHLEFFESQNKISHDVANIVKFWLQTVDFQGKIFSDATIISEIISSHSTLDLESKGMKSVFEGVFNAICSMARMSVLRLGFFQEEGVWKAWNNANSRHTPPYILLPLEPQDSALADLTADVTENLQLNALILKTRLGKLVDKREYCVVDRSHTLNVLFDKLLAPVAFEMFLDFCGKQAAVYVTLGFPKDPAVVPIYPTGQHKAVLETMLALLTDVVGAVTGLESGAMRQLKPTASRARLNRKVTEVAKQVVKKVLPSILVSGVNKTCLKLEWFDTIIAVPYRSLDGMSVMAGFKWDAKHLPRFDDFMFY